MLPNSLIIRLRTMGMLKSSISPNDQNYINVLRKMYLDLHHVWLLQFKLGEMKIDLNH